MQIADSGETKPDAGVTATSPATSPVAKPRPVGLPPRAHSTRSQVIAAAAAATCEAARATPARALAPPALPPLKPNQPNQSRPAPTRLRTTLLGWMACSG